MISLIVFRKRYFCLASDIVTSAKTLSRKNLALPIVILPKLIEAAYLTSSLGETNACCIRLNASYSLLKSTNLPNSPRHKSPGMLFAGLV